MSLKYSEYKLLYDIGSGINFNRPNFNKILNYAIKYKDRL